MTIVTVPNPVLTRVADRIDNFSAESTHLLTNWADEMLKLIKDIGVGLAAPQVGLSTRLIVVTVKSFPPLIMCNPEIKWAKGEQTSVEGCLSIPGAHVEVKRAFKIKVDYQLPSGTKKSITANQYLARVIQHEIDHLDGILITDHKDRA